MKGRWFSCGLPVVLLLSWPAFSQQSGRTPPRRSSSAASQAAAQQAEDRQAIEELYQAEIRANLALDTDAMAGLFDPDIVIMEPGHPPFVGTDGAQQYLAQLKQQLAPDEILGYNQEWKEVQPLGEYAVEWGTISGRLRPSGGGDEIDYTYDVMRVLKRQPSGTWKIYRWIWNSAEAPEKAPAGVKSLTPTEKPKPEKEKGQEAPAGP